MWAICFREKVNHGDDNTTSICEGYHSALKQVLRAEFTEGLRVDRFIHHLFEFVAAEFVHRSIVSLSGAH
jgi:hypothetical protein